MAIFATGWPTTPCGMTSTGTPAATWSVGAQVGLGAGVVVACVAVPAIISATTAGGAGLRGAGARDALAPPSGVFIAVWTVLYILAGIAITLAALSADNARAWVGVALAAAAVVLSWGWPAVWGATSGNSSTGNLPPGAPSWTILALGAAVAVAAALAAPNNPTAAVLWVPWLAWLVFALVLASRQVAAPAAA
jgi:tryptophan-rich sensory protein